MGPNHRAIGHQTFQVGIVGTKSKKRLENVLFAPTGKAFVDAIPVAILCWEQAPLRAATRDPEHSREELAAFPLRANIDVGTGPQKC